jgi:hypothetical protein
MPLVNPPATLVFNVKGYGATGNGTTDDAAACQLAIAAAAIGGGTAYFPAGTYKLGTRLAGASGVVLDFAPGAVLKPADATNAIAATSVSNFRVRGGKIDGSLQTTGGTGIQLVTCTDVAIEGVEVASTYKHGIDIRGGTRIAVARCHIHHVGDAMPAASFSCGIAAYGFTGLLVRGNRIHDCTRQFAHGVRLYVQAGAEASASRFVVVDNLIDACGSADAAGGGGGIGVQSTDAYRISVGTIAGNTCTNCGDGGIWVQGDVTTIGGNTIDTTLVGGGIEVSDAREVTVVGNTISNTYSHGIYAHPGGGDGATHAYGLLGCAITGNTVQGSQTAEGIMVGDNSPATAYIAEVQGVSVTGNTCRRNATDGILIRPGNRYTVMGNTCLDNGTSGGATDAGINTSAASGAPITGLLIVGNTCSETRSGGARTQDYGVRIVNYVSQCRVLDNDLRNNVTFPASFGAGAGSVNVVLRNNVGLEAGAPVAVTVTASPFTYVAAAQEDEQVWIEGGTVSDIKLDITGGTGGATVAASVPTSVLLPANQSLTVTYTVAPTMRRRRL